MPSAPTAFRATTVLLVCAGGLAACGPATTSPRAAPGAPSTMTVVRARFVSSVDLDHGGLLVTAAPAAARPRLSDAEAEAMFDATDAVQGRYAFSILGLGLVTVATRVEEPAPTTTSTTIAPPAASTVPPTTDPPPPPPRPTTTTAPPPRPTTTTTVAPAAATSETSTRSPAATLVAAPATTSVPLPSGTSTPATTPSTTAPTGGPPPPALPTYHRRLAWVGFAWGATETCAGSTTTQPSTSTTYVAVIIDATTGNRVLAYRSGGATPCTGTARGPAVTEPNELVSVPWSVVGPSSTAVQIHVPPCGRYYGWTQIQVAGGGVADQVVVADPFDPGCGATAAVSQAIDQVVPLGSGQNQVGHAAVGPVEALQTLPDS